MRSATGAKVNVSPDTPKHTGHLRIFTYEFPRNGHKIRVACLMPRPEAYSYYVLDELEEVELTVLKGQYFILHGKQHVRRGKKIFSTHMQSWLVRPLLETAIQSQQTTAD